MHVTIRTCTNMSARADGLLNIILTLAWIVGTLSDAKNVNTCIAEDSQYDILSELVCLQDGLSVELLCPSSAVIVLTSVQFAVKNSTITRECMQRVQTNKFCCKPQSKDDLYRGECLQEFWNAEDTEHYQTFLRHALGNCMQKHKCSLELSLFENVQRQIPQMQDVYSSYIKIVYQCITLPTDPIRLCSSSTTVSSNVHIKGITHHKIKNNTCTCTAVSQTEANLVVTAVDVRATDVEGTGAVLLLKTNSFSQYVDKLPAFGFKEVLSSARKINITLKNTDGGHGLNIWIRVKAKDNSKVNVTCSEQVLPVVQTTSSPGVVFGIKEDLAKSISESFYWPLILACGSFITLCAFVIVVVSIYLCKRRRDKQRNRQEFQSIPSIITTKEYSDIYDPPYATVLDHQNPPRVLSARVARSHSSQTLQRAYTKTSSIKTYNRSTSLKSLRERPPMAPPPPPPVNPGMQEATGEIYNQLHFSPGLTRNDVEQLQVFLEGSERRMEFGTFKALPTGVNYDSPFTISSRLGVRQPIYMDPASNSSPGFSDMFENDGCPAETLLLSSPVSIDLMGDSSDVLPLTESDGLLGEGVGTPTHMEPSDFFRHPINRSGRNKEDENHNMFNTVIS